MSLLTQAGHQVQTSVAILGGRQWRLNNWLTQNMLGCIDCPCEISSVPQANLPFTLNYADGRITDECLDLSSVIKNPDCSLGNCGERIVTINNQVRDCELTGCEGVSINENKKVYLTHCCASSDNDTTPIKIYLTNNGVPVTEDEFGNKVPEFYLLGVGQIKYLCVVNGRITRIVN
jgi:hypothetical protein